MRRYNKAMKFTCPMCGKPAARRGKGAQEREGAGEYFPFCSERCKLIDLGAWFEGEYKIGRDEADNGENDAES